LNPFLTLKYDTNGFNLDELDVINKPAYVIPSSSLRLQLTETDPKIRLRILFTAIPYAFFNRDDWEDLSRGLTWSETDVSQGETIRLIGYQCTAQERLDAMNRCIHHLVMDLPVPMKLALQEKRNRFKPGVTIRNLFLCENDVDNADDDDDDLAGHVEAGVGADDFDFQVDEGLQDEDMAAMELLVR
jgi:hypothetical protein